MGKYVDRLRNPLAMAAFYEVKIADSYVHSQLKGDIIISDREDFIRTATFTLYGNPFVSKLSRFSKVSIYGGSNDPNNRRYLFKGVVKKIDAAFPRTGVPEITVTAYGGAVRGTKGNKKIVYPSPNCERQWARSNEIKLSDIVKNILSEVFYDFPADIDIRADRTFNVLAPFIQSGTDWMALKELARLSECILAEVSNDTDNGEHKIMFVDRKSAISLSDKDETEYPISFRYLERKIESDFEFVVDTLKEGEVAVDRVDFNMDVDLNAGSLRIVSDFNEGGDAKTFLQRYDEESEKIIFYELKDDSYFSSLSDDVVNKFWRRLTYNWDEVTFDEIRQFFKDPVDVNQNKVPGYEQSEVGMQGAGPLGWVGYTINVECIGDTRIQPYRSYAIYGIGKYSSKEGGGNRYYLRSMDNILGADGYTQKLNFYR